MNRRLDRARQRLIDVVEEAAQNEGLDVATASNVAADLATQDHQLTALCETQQALVELEEQRSGDRSEVWANVLAAGMDVDDAIEARVAELVDDAIEQTEAALIEQEATA